jgi:Tol biopolymer transport system component
MHIAPGTRLGPYEILAPLGAGGMGEVWRARDLRLGREVAIKVLPGHLSSNPEVRARFEREARTVSSLNHPHICVLHDVGRAPGAAGSGDTDYLVMELVEGETLAARLEKGPLPMVETLRFGAQIADALDRAHRAGVVHRDLKPGNVMLTRAGAKLLDFGLARATGLAAATDSSGGATTLSRSPTVAASLTSEGTLVGTFQYMSPEQLEGREADARSDLWALGCVLYEMASGRRAFEGRSQASLIGAIMTGEPPSLASTGPFATPGLERLVRACLAKDPAARVQSAHDVKLQLEWLADGGSAAGIPAPAVAAPPRAGREGLAWGAAAAFAVAALVLAALLVRAGGEARPVLRASLTFPPDVALSITGDDSGPPAISPDGRMLVFSARGRGAGQRLWVRALDDLAARPLHGTEDGSYPFWSPDGRSIGFFTTGRLKRVDVEGGAVLTVCPAANGRGGTWSRDGTILFAPDWLSSLWRVPATGGTPQAVTTLDTTVATTHRWPQFMPDGKHFIYLSARHDDPAASAALWFGSLDGPAPRRLIESPSNGAYVSGWLVFVRDSVLLAQRLDPSNGRLSGALQPTRETVQFDPTTWRAMMTIAEDGTLVYSPGGGSGAYRVTWFDRAGRRLGTVGPPGNHFTVEVSPDGGHAVVETQVTPNADLWVYDLASGAGTRLAPHPADDSQPVWSPDGAQLAFATRRGGDRYRVDAMRADGAGVPRTLVEDPAADAWVLQWFDGGRSLLLGRGTFQSMSGEGDELWRHPLDGGRPRLLLPRSLGFGNAQVSPDERWLAFDSPISGRNEVYVVPMPRRGAGADTAAGDAPGGRWQVSIDGGIQPRWGRDGRELFYRRPDDTIIAATVLGEGAGFRVLQQRPLFQAFQRGLVPTLSLAPDGERLLISTASAEHMAPLVVVTGWHRTPRGSE